jgi:hypothetical protein
MSGLKPQNMPSREKQAQAVSAHFCSNMQFGHNLDFEWLKKTLK